MKLLQNNYTNNRSEVYSFLRKTKGFSLVEFMIGSGVMTLVLAGCFSGIGQALLISENVKSSNFAAQVLLSEMDEIHTMQWTEVDQLPSSGSFDPKAYFSIVPLRDYNCQRAVTNLGSLQKEIRLTVSWKDLKGLSHDREYVTYYTKDGLYDYTYRAL